MEIEVTQEKLAKALGIVSRIAVGKVTLPVLNNVLIRVDNKKTTLTTTNLDMAVIDFLPVSNAKDGVVTVPARLLTEFVTNLPRGEVIKIQVKDTKIVVTSGKYTSTINGTSADDFPELPEINEKKAVVFKMGIEEFKNGINQVIIACSNDTTRPALTGVYFNTYDKILAVAATDGYRLTERKLIEKVDSEVAAIVPASSLQEVMRSIGDEMEEIEISFSEDLIRFRLGEVEVISKLIDASFPDYQKLIPKENEIEIDVKREELSRVTKLAALFARGVGGSIICETRENNVFAVRAVANEFGENDSEIETKVEKIGKVTLNSRFLIDALNVLDEAEISLAFSNRVAPVVIRNKKNKNYTHIIMPLNS